MIRSFSRREMLVAAAGVLGTGLSPGEDTIAGGAYELSTFTTDVTPPVGHPMLVDLSPPAKAVDDPLLANGFVLKGAGQPVVLVAVDWMEIRNDAYDRWRAVLAEAAKTVPSRVLVSCLHSHDAPTADLEAQKILQRHGLRARVCDLDFHEAAVQRVARALRQGLTKSRPITHLGLGQAKVKEVASNRRYLGPDGKPRFDRGSATTDPYARAQPENTIDPWLKTPSFWDHDQPVAAVTAYATHPQSYYRTGRVTCDFPGLARNRRQADDPRVMQIQVAGASGNVTAGKYNDGSPQNRVLLADRVYRAMVASWAVTRRQPLRQCEFRTAALHLRPREGPRFTVEDLEKQLVPATGARASLAALGLSWRKRVEAGRPLDVPALDFGNAQLVLLPAEAYIEFQLYAQELRPDSFVVVLGYGECAPGYIPIERAWREGDSNLNDWCWVAPGAERSLKTALAAVLKPPVAR
jgi:hypothetical protein